jgi:hypothetical protein
MTPRHYRLALFVLAGFWVVLGIGALARGDYLQCGISVVWVLVALFRVRFGGSEDRVERQRARLEGFGALTFQADADSRPERE